MFTLCLYMISLSNTEEITSSESILEEVIEFPTHSIFMTSSKPKPGDPFKDADIIYCIRFCPWEIQSLI